MRSFLDRIARAIVGDPEPTERPFSEVEREYLEARRADMALQQRMAEEERITRYPRGGVPKRQAPKKVSRDKMAKRSRKAKGKR